MTRALVVIVTLALCFGGAEAQPAAYDPEEVVDFFANQQNSASGICIGRASECDGGTGDVQTQSGFDLTVSFRFASAILTPEAERNLDAFAEALVDARLQGLRFMLEGHTDANGPDSINQWLSEERAKSVAAYLARQGIDPDVLETAGYGESRPLTANPYDPANRRVEARVVVRGL